MKFYLLKLKKIMTNFETIRKYFMNFKSMGLAHIDFKTRASGFLSPNGASRIKKAIELWPSLTPEEVNKLMEEFNSYSNKIEEMVNKAQEAKTPVLSGASDSIREFVQRIKTDAQPFIEEQKKSIDKHLRDLYEQIQSLIREGGRKAFNAKYAPDVFGDWKKEQKFYNSLVYKLSNIDNVMPIIQKQTSAYEQGEYHKIEHMFHRLVKKYPQIKQYTLKNARTSGGSLEYVMTGVDDSGETYTINTSTIGAGGYNIQIFHFRWIMSVTDSNGKTVKINTGK